MSSLINFEKRLTHGISFRFVLRKYLLNEGDEVVTLSKLKQISQVFFIYNNIYWPQNKSKDFF